MPDLKITYPTHHLNRARFLYTIKFINKHPLRPQGTKLIPIPSTDNSYTVSTNNCILSIPAQRVFFNPSLPKNQDLISNRYHYKNNQLYSVELVQSNHELFHSDSSLAFDIFETVFFHISRFEEVMADHTQVSQAGWLEEKKHFLIANHIHETPVVDELLTAFFDILNPNPQHIKIPTQYSISHDIDIIEKYPSFTQFIKSIFSGLYYRRGLPHIRKSVLNYFFKRTGKGKDPYDFFDSLLRPEEHWISKTIYVMSGGSTKFDNKYDLKDPKLKDILELALSRGYEIGFHPSYLASENHDAYALELNFLEKYLNIKILHNRQHWLRFNWNSTPYFYEKNSIKEDSSMGYNAHIGFRCGTGFKYHLYDFKSERAFSWLEQPLSLMESAVITSAQEVGRDIKDILTEFISINKYNTHITLNFHNSNFDPTLETGLILQDFYENELLKLVEKE